MAAACTPRAHQVLDTSLQGLLGLLLQSLSPHTGLGLPSCWVRQVKATQGMSLSDGRLAVSPAQGCLDKGVQDLCPSWHYSPQHAVLPAALAGAQCSMPGPVVLLPSKNAILDFFWAGCSPISCSSKRLPSHGLAGSDRGIAAVRGARSSQQVPMAPAALARPARSMAGGPGTPSCGCCILRALPGSQKLPGLARRQQGSAALPQRHPGLAATSGIPAPARGHDAHEHQGSGLVLPFPV